MLQQTKSTISNVRRATRNRTFTINHGDTKLFGKIFADGRDAGQEIEGYDSIKDYYKVPQRHGVFDRKSGRKIIVYSYAASIGKDNGLFADLLNQEGDEEALMTYMYELTDHYREVMLRSLSLSHKDRVKTKLYEDRLRMGGRIDQYYHMSKHNRILLDKFGVQLKTLKDYEFLINSRSYRFDWSEYVETMRRNLLDNPYCWAALTQGDPTELNLGWPLQWFDYDNAGLNSVLGEFANFMWYVFALGGSIVPMYNQPAFVDHPRCLLLAPNSAPTISYQVERAKEETIKISYRTNIGVRRRIALRVYLERLVKPVVAHLGRASWETEFSWYLSLRIIGVYNLFNLTDVDRIFLLAKLIESQENSFRIEDFFEIA